MRPAAAALLLLAGCVRDPAPAEPPDPQTPAACGFGNQRERMANATFSMLVCVLDDEGSWNAIDTGESLPPGTKLAVNLQLYREGFVYILGESMSGERTLLYPSEEYGEQEHSIIPSMFRIPTMDSDSPYIELESSDDCSLGEEKLIAVVSEQPLPEGHAFYASIAHLRDEPEELEPAVEPEPEPEPEPESKSNGDDAGSSEGSGPSDDDARDQARPRPRSKRPSSSGQGRVRPHASKSPAPGDGLDAPWNERPASRGRRKGTVIDVRAVSSGIAVFEFRYDQAAPILPNDRCWKSDAPASR